MGSIPYKEINFSKTKIVIQNKKFEFYTSPILNRYKFLHAFFTKSSSEEFLELLSNFFDEKQVNCVLNQIHSKKIVFGSQSEKGMKIDADGLVGDKRNQNLWVYTADCLPIFFADKITRNVAALHCGRKGLEKRIINTLVKFFDNLGSSRDDLLVAIGPAISKKNYPLDKKTLKEFYRKTEDKALTNVLCKSQKKFCDLDNFKEQNLNQLDLRRYAYLQLLNENIPNKNIDISNLCTYELKDEFNSWRRSKTTSRQWNFIC